MNKSANELITEFLAECRFDPLKYVLGAFPWESEPSIQVSKLPEQYRKRFPNVKFGPDKWQCEFLDNWGAEMSKRSFNGTDPVDAIRNAVVSGHGVGKSTISAWAVKFILDTRPYSIGTVTANTAPQLYTKTWAEVGKWHAMSLTADWFTYHNSKNNMILRHKQFPDTWKCTAQTCDPKNSESFAGQHTSTSTSFYIFDEASNIDEKLYEVREGGLIGGEPMVFDFGNGTRNSGRFFENCVGRFADQYRVWCVDSRQAQRTNKKKIEDDISRYGIDSDYIRVRWLGKFPNKASTQFISAGQVRTAQERMTPVLSPASPLFLGVDVARWGTDESVIYPRVGYDARSYAPRRYRGISTTRLAEEVIQYIREFEQLGITVTSVFVDGGGGYGGGVVDTLRDRNVPVVEVVPAGKPVKTTTYMYKIDEMYGDMREALDTSLVLPTPDSQLGKEIFEQMTQREFGYTLKDQVRLESKDSMKDRGLSSPDLVDSLALTFAVPMLSASAGNQGVYVNLSKDYDPFAWS